MMLMKTSVSNMQEISKLNFKFVVYLRNMNSWEPQIAIGL